MIRLPPLELPIGIRRLPDELTTGIRRLRNTRYEPGFVAAAIAAVLFAAVIAILVSQLFGNSPLAGIIGPPKDAPEAATPARAPEPDTARVGLLESGDAASPGATAIPTESESQFPDPTDRAPSSPVLGTSEGVAGGNPGGNRGSSGLAFAPPQRPTDPVSIDAPSPTPTPGPAPTNPPGPIDPPPTNPPPTNPPPTNPPPTNPPPTNPPPTQATTTQPAPTTTAAP